MIKKYGIIIIVSIIALAVGGGTGYIAHDCGEQEPIKVKLGLDGTVPVEVTCVCECLNDPCEVTIESQTRDEGPCENPPLIFEIEPAWNAGFAVGSHVLSADFTWDIKKSRFDPYIQAVYITDYSEIQSTSDYSWYKDPTFVSASDTKWLVGVRFHGKRKHLASGSDSGGGTLVLPSD